MTLIDRYLAKTEEVPKTRLQLLGVTCLFVAAKIEEIYPPKLGEFTYVTDGACSDEEILQMELVVLKELNWGLSPMTPNAWVKLFMQVGMRSVFFYQSEKPGFCKGFSEGNRAFQTEHPSFRSKIRNMSPKYRVKPDFRSIRYTFSSKFTNHLIFSCRRPTPTRGLRRPAPSWRPRSTPASPSAASCS